MSERKPRTNWQDKMPPVFLAMAAFNREAELRWQGVQTRQRNRRAQLPRTASKAERLAADEEFHRDEIDFLAWLEGEAGKIRNHYPIVMGSPTAFSYFTFPTERPLEEYVHWERHGESLTSSVQEERAGNIKALERIQRTFTDLWRVLRGRGPLKRFQGDMVHRQLLELIICFEPEATPLTAAERADCVDEYCACKRIHDSEALRKQYARLKKQLERARNAAERGQAEIK